MERLSLLKDIHGLTGDQISRFQLGQCWEVSPHGLALRSSPTKQQTNPQPQPTPTPHPTHPPSPLTPHPSLLWALETVRRLFPPRPELSLSDDHR